MAPHKVDKVTDVLHEGQMVKVKLVGFDDRGKTKLSMKVVDQETGEDLSAKFEAERAEREAARIAAGGEPRPEREDRGERPDRGDRGDRSRRPRNRGPRRERTEEPAE